MSVRARDILRAGIIAGTVLFVYQPAFHGGFFWDDPAEISANASLQSWGGLWRMWVSPGTPDYYPLKQSLQWLQWHLWGAGVTGYHLTNVGLHIVSCLLFWKVLGALGVRRAWLGGLLFAVHPLAVESVAWISEFKNVLSLPLMLLSFLAYLRWDALRNDEGGNLKPENKTAFKFQLSAFIFFLASMLSKSSVVMFPFVLLLYAWWKRGRVVREDLRRVAPFLAVSVVLGVVTLCFQETVAIRGITVPQGGVLSRTAVAGLAIAHYVRKVAWPSGLLPIYPRWQADPARLWQFWPWPVLALVLVLLWRSRRHPAARHGLFGAGFFLLNLVPVLGFVPMSFLRISWVADHFAYLPMLGLVGLASAVVGFLAGDGGGPPGRPAPVVTICAFSLLAVVSAFVARGHACIFASERAAWTYTLARNPDAWLAPTTSATSCSPRGGSTRPARRSRRPSGSSRTSRRPTTTTGTSCWARTACRRPRPSSTRR
jgi:protein O-mannosyl-transferase